MYFSLKSALKFLKGCHPAWVGMHTFWSNLPALLVFQVTQWSHCRLASPYLLLSQVFRACRVRHLSPFDINTKFKTMPKWVDNVCRRSWANLTSQTGYTVIQISLRVLKLEYFFIPPPLLIKYNIANCLKRIISEISWFGSQFVYTQGLLWAFQSIVFLIKCSVSYGFLNKMKEIKSPKNTRELTSYFRGMALFITNTISNVKQNSFKKV